MAATAAKVKPVKKAAAKSAAKSAEPQRPVDVDLVFEIERTTSNTYRFKEVAEPGEEVIGPLYVKKHHFGEFVPSSLTVTVRVD